MTITYNGLTLGTLYNNNGSFTAVFGSNYTNDPPLVVNRWLLTESDSPIGCR